MAKRKSKNEFAHEHKHFLELVKKNQPNLEVMIKLNLNRTQLKAHLLEAYSSGEVQAGDWQPYYEILTLGSFPDSVQKQLKKAFPQASEDDFVKAEIIEDKVIISTYDLMGPDQLPMAPWPIESTSQGKQEMGTQNRRVDAQ
ncbi:hypothetical protein ACUZ9P_01975 [Desulfovibrio sp. QI0430]